MSPRTLIKLKSYFGDRKVHYQSSKIIVKRIFSGHYNRVKILSITHPEPHRHRLAMLPYSGNLLAKLMKMKKKELKQFIEKLPLSYRYDFINHIFVIYDPDLKHFEKVKFIEITVTPIWKLLIVLNQNPYTVRVVIHHVNHFSSDIVDLPSSYMLLFLHVIKMSEDEKIILIKLQAYNLSKETIKTIMKFIRSHGRISLEKMHSKVAQIQKKRILYQIKQQYRDQLSSIDLNYSYFIPSQNS